MQIIEVSVTGVRSAVLTLRRGPTPMEFVLVPMIHLGTAAFYAEVKNRLAECQLVVAEGVRGRSFLARALTLAYRLPGRSRRLNLVVQDDRYADCGVPVICPDITARQFTRFWRSVPAVQRMLVWVAVPVVALITWAVGTRRFISRGLATTDLPTLLDHEGRQTLPKFTELILDRRDNLLLEALATIHEQHSAEPIRVAVVYGAGHVPAVVRGLWSRYGYRPRTAEWLTVFDF